MKNWSRYVHMHMVLAAGGMMSGCSAQAVPRAPSSGLSSAAPFRSVRAISVEEHDIEFHDVKFRDGQVLPTVRSHYSTTGTPIRDASGRITNAVLMLHWTGSSGDVLQGQAFASALYGAGKPLDLSRYYLVFVDAIGHGRSSKPSEGLRARFPAYGYEDMVTLQYRTVTEGLGLPHLRAIVGISMGGMNAWRWAERYPTFMDAIVPVVALPAPISGRNLIWRRFVARQIRNDPSWNGGNYTAPPRGWTESFPVFRMLLDGVPHLHDTVKDRASADAFLRDASTAAAQMDANDLLYALEASGDYDPSGALESIRARVFALNFGDDEFNPVSLGILERSMARVQRGVAVVQPGNAHSFGHFTQAHPELWADQLGSFLHALESTP